MSTLSESRTALAEALGTDEINSFDHVPEALEAPCLVVQPAEKYLDVLSDDETFSPGDFSQALDVWVVVEVASNQHAAGEIDKWVEHVVSHLPGEWGLDGVSRPGPLGTAGWTAHGCRITVSRHINL